MKKSLLVTSAFLFGISGLVVAGDHPSFTDADSDQDGILDMRELTTALPELDLEAVATTTVTAADVKQVMPLVDFADEDVVNAAPIGLEQYQQIVEAMVEQTETNAVTHIE